MFVSVYLVPSFLLTVLRFFPPDLFFFFSSYCVFFFVVCVKSADVTFIY